MAYVPREELGVHAVRAWVQLWYSALEPTYLERRWWVLFGHTPVTGRSFPSLPQRCDLFPCDSADQVRSFLGLGSLTLTRTRTLSLTLTRALSLTTTLTLTLAPTRTRSYAERPRGRRW